MTDLEKTLLIVGITALVILIAIAVRWYIRKNCYEYNECTGEMERKSKKKTKARPKTKENVKMPEAEAPEFIPNSVDKRSVKYVPKDEYFEEWLFVKAVEKQEAEGKYIMKFCNYFDEEEFITLFVDEETFTDCKLGDSGKLCYNFKYSIFHYFDKGPKIFKDDK